MKHSFVLAIATEALFGSLVLVCYVLRFSSAIVHLRGKSFSIPFIDAPARLAIGVNSSGLCGALHLADPLDACSSLRNGLRSEEPDKVRFALISRGNCAFEDKIRNAQYGGFHAAIVYDDRDKRNLVSMIGDSDGISVHAVFVSKAAGETLKMLARAEEGECCISPSLEEAAWTVLSYRGDLCHLSQDYKDGETLRVLPCQHEFHASCVDSWLTKWGTFCPVCKHDMNADRTGYEAMSEGHY